MPKLSMEGAPSPESGKEANAMQKMLETEIASNKPSDLIPEGWIENIDEAQKEAYRLKFIAKISGSLPDILKNAEPSAGKYESVSKNDLIKSLFSPREQFQKFFEDAPDAATRVFAEVAIGPLILLQAAYVELGARVLAWQDNKALATEEKKKKTKK